MDGIRYLMTAFVLVKSLRYLSLCHGRRRDTATVLVLVWPDQMSPW